MKYVRFSRFLAALGLCAACLAAAAAAKKFNAKRPDGRTAPIGSMRRVGACLPTTYAIRWGRPTPRSNNGTRLSMGSMFEGLARQLKACGAGYYCITVGQNSGFYCSPNAVYDKCVGILPSKCSRRDLIADLYPALERQGIKLMVYLPSNAPDRDPIAVKALQWKNGPHRNREFQMMWEDVIRAWSKRWGTRVKGWWFDGCYFADAMYRQPDPPGFATFAAAARAGNPQSIVAFNPGVTVPVIHITEHEDYTAGEIQDAIGIACPGRWVGGAQWHMLSYLGPNWFAGPKPRYSDPQVIDVTRKILAKGGVVAWDVNIQANGLIPRPFYEQLLAIGKAVR